MEIPIFEKIIKQDEPRQSSVSPIRYNNGYCTVRIFYIFLCIFDSQPLVIHKNSAE